MGLGPPSFRTSLRQKPTYYINISVYIAGKEEKNKGKNRRKTRKTKRKIIMTTTKVKIVPVATQTNITVNGRKEGKQGRNEGQCGWVELEVVYILTCGGQIIISSNLHVISDFNSKRRHLVSAILFFFFFFVF